MNTGSSKKSRVSISSPRTTENRLRSKLEKKVYFNEIGGLKIKIDLLKSILLSPLNNEKQYEELGKYPPTGVLIYGLPGTGN